MCCVPQGSKGGAASLSAAELLSLLRSDFSMDDVPQSGVVSEEMLEQLLDRDWMLEGEAPPQATPSKKQSPAAGRAKGGRLSRSNSTTAVAAAAAAAEAGPSKSSERDAKVNLPYPATGVGYEVVKSIESNVLSNVN
jgi:hypothetical protein